MELDKHLHPAPAPIDPNFGRYRLLDLLGEGGMASVYRAEMQGIGGFSKIVALKVVHPHLALQPEFTRWFISEARLGGFLSHPNIVETLDFGEFERRLYLAMEYVNGPTLDGILTDLANRGERMPVDVALQFMVQVCHGLSYAHQAVDRDGQPLRMVHRDLKPSNILVSAHGQIKLADFGVARAESNLVRTQASGVIKGTVRYMSPEQAWGMREIDQRSDIFTLGNILFELLTMEPLYEGKSQEALLRRAQDAEIGHRLQLLPDCSIRDGLIVLLGRSLAAEPDARYQSAQELGEAMEALLGGLTGRQSLHGWLVSTVRGFYRPPTGSTGSLSNPRSAGAVASGGQDAQAAVTLMDSVLDSSGVDRVQLGPGGSSPSLVSQRNPGDPEQNLQPSNSQLNLSRPGSTALPPEAQPTVVTRNPSSPQIVAPGTSSTARSGAMVAAGGVLIALLAVGGFFAIQRPAEKPVEPPDPGRSGAGAARAAAPGPGSTTGPGQGNTTDPGTVARPPEPPPVQQAAVEITSEPSGATIMVAGQRLTNTTPSVVPLPLEQARAFIRLERDGYKPYVQELTYKPGDRLGVSAKLEPTEETIKATPKKPADPNLQHSQFGDRPPPSMPRPPTGPGSRPSGEKTSPPASGGSADLSASLFLNSRPQATIRVDGKATRGFPVTDLRVTPGSHSITYVLPTGEQLEKAISIESGATIRCTANFEMNEVRCRQD